MVDIPAGWLALVGTVLTAIGAAIGVFLKSKDKDIADRDARIKELQERVDSMQARQIENLQQQIEALRSRRQVDAHLADAIVQLKPVAAAAASAVQKDAAA
jgi:ABC-type phosphate transport system auxiliary subunit